jgi:hypothetical protein
MGIDMERNFSPGGREARFQAYKRPKPIFTAFLDFPSVPGKNGKGPLPSREATARQASCIFSRIFHFQIVPRSPF